MAHQTVFYNDLQIHFKKTLSTGEQFWTIGPLVFVVISEKKNKKQQNAVGTHNKMGLWRISTILTKKIALPRAGLGCTGIHFTGGNGILYKPYLH